jgi:hypothetical protein
MAFRCWVNRTLSNNCGAVQLWDTGILPCQAESWNTGHAAAASFLGVHGSPGDYGA